MPVRISRLLIVGLGNHTHPNTRHNAGFIALDYAVHRLIGPGAWTVNKAIGAWVAETIMPLEEGGGGGEEEIQSVRHVTFMKPRTFMNFNGVPVQKMVWTQGFTIPELVVVHDDLEREIGKCSVKNGGSAGGHNGIKSIISCLKTDVRVDSHSWIFDSAFKRIRVGIGRTQSKAPTDVANYVLSQFTPDQKEKVTAVMLPAFYDTLLDVIKEHKE
ncbi:peptidyl-tRNA hydrolase protein 1 [Borealophlyctis nickersoniae]|nr:peptidyl-tRNA hydrolase protein 1 [Borealophlyctis nickersoniae]